MLMVAASFVIGVALMNLFLAILCLAYSEAYERAHLTFMKARVHIVLDQHAVRCGLSQLCCTKRSHGQAKSVGNTQTSKGSFFAFASPNLRRTLALTDHHDALTGFLWFAEQAAANDK